ncbi:AzlC family ABC transporter permease [Candidatus Pelagibacter sp. HIMB1517]|uniref:AzlC family ABC transporter permease n=1 Tax=Candidatus Pelagibacter sp. HIMB1517 TaxID=3413341 RepID=UPI003F8511BA
MLSSQSFKDGVKHAIGVPALGLGSSMFAFGAFLHSAGFDIYQSFFSTFFTFALPGQFVMAETILAGGTLLNIFLAVLLTNSRLYPMTVNITPLIRNSNVPKWKQYIGAHFIAVTSWFNFFSVQKNIKEDEKFNYFVGLGGFLWANSVVCTVAGYLFSNLVPHEILIALVFINPMYFLVMTVSNLEEKKIICSILVGATLSIFLNNVFPGWSVLIAGVLAGTLGFFIFRKENNE